MKLAEKNNRIGLDLIGEILIPKIWKNNPFMFQTTNQMIFMSNNNQRDSCSICVGETSEMDVSQTFEHCISRGAIGNRDTSS